MTELFYRVAGTVLAPFRYAEREVQHFKEVAREDVQAFMASLIKLGIIAIVGSLFLLFLSIGVAALINQSMGSEYLGYVFVAGFYLLVTIIAFISKEVSDKKAKEIHDQRKASHA